MAKITDERKQHLELVAATLTGSYYSIHSPGNRDFREIMDTYRYLLDALIEQDNLPPGHSSLTATDGLAPFVPDEND